MSSQPLISLPDRERAVAYIVERLDDSLLVQQFGAFFPGNGKVVLVTACEPPDKMDYYSDWGSDSGTTWLEDEIVGYLKLNPNAVVLFEDTVSSPTDGFLSSRERPHYWSYLGRIFWPVIPVAVSRAAAEAAIAWTAGYKKMGVFTTFPGDFPPLLSDYLISEHEFQYMAASITRLVTDVFDGGGYLIWEREK